MPTAPDPVRPATRPTATNRRTARKTRLIVVYGYTCDKTPKLMNSRTWSLRAIAGNGGKVAHVDIECNTEDPKNMTRNIVRRLFLPKKPLPDTQFVRRVRASVCAALRRGERVILAGHSYGGSVVTRIAESVECGDAGQLDVVTFGSIYMRSLRAIQSGVRIRQYAYQKDIAAACHRRNITACSFVTPIPTKRNPLQAHMEYQAFIDEIARTGSITIDIATVLARLAANAKKTTKRKKEAVAPAP